MSDKESWDLQIALNKVSSMTVDKFQTECEKNNIKCWEIDHMVYDLAKALTLSRSKEYGRKI